MATDKIHSITIRMARTLQLVIETRGTEYVGEPEMLVRRGLLCRAPESQRPRVYRVTPEGRETLAAHYARNHTDTVQQPSVVTSCRYWQDFYGLTVEMRFQDDDEIVRWEVPSSFGSDNGARRYIVRELTERRRFLLACCPEAINNPDAEE